LEDFRVSLSKGSFFAIKDTGIIKNKYPMIREISYDGNSIEITTDGKVNWVSNGQLIHSGKKLLLDDLPVCLSYIRAEISNINGTVYSQPFSIEELNY
jgi:hypothetical protein